MQFDRNYRSPNEFALVPFLIGFYWIETFASISIFLPCPLFVPLFFFSPTDPLFHYSHLFAHFPFFLSLSLSRFFFFILFSLSFFSLYLCLSLSLSRSTFFFPCTSFTSRRILANIYPARWTDASKSRWSRCLIIMPCETSTSYKRRGSMDRLVPWRVHPLFHAEWTRRFVLGDFYFYFFFLPPAAK